MARKVQKIKERPFSSQSKLLNDFVSKHELMGKRNYFHPNDLREIYDNYNGFCCYCGLELVSKKQRVDSANFSFRIPLKAGGSISKDNIVLLCHRCKFFRCPKRPVSRPIFGFDAFSDLVVRLIEAVIEKHQGKTQYYQVKLDQALADYIGMLFYKPLGTPEEVGLTEMEKLAPVSEIVKELTLELEKVMKLGTFTKEYKVERQIEE